MEKKLVRKIVAMSAMMSAVGAIGLVPTYAASNPPLTILAQESSSWTDNFNPFAVANLQMPNGEIYQSLFYFSTTGPQYPMLGTSMKWSKANKTLTVGIRQGVKWNDGTAFTAKDVVYTYNLLKKYPALDTNAIWAALSSVKLKGADSVQFNFKSAQVPFAQIVLSQVPIVPEHIWSTVKGDPSKWTDPNPVGTGPYMLGSFSAQTYTLKANPNYWGGAPAAPELIYPAIPSAQPANLQLVSGRLDWADEFIQNINKLYVAKNPTTNHYYFPPVADVSIFPNLTNPILKNPVVRQAMSDAINRTQIDQVGEYGYEPPANPTGLILPNQKKWLDPSLSTKFTYNVAEANALLNKAGFKMGPNGVRQTKDGKKLVFNLIAPNGWTDWNEDQTLIAQDLKKIGIQINVQEPQQTDWTNELLTHHFELALESSSYTQVGNTPFQGLRSNFYPGTQQNYEQLNDPVMKKALDNFQTSSNPATEKKAMYAIEREFEKTLPVIPLVYAANWYEYSTKNYTNWPSEKNNYADASPATSFANGVVLTHLKPAH